MSKYIINPLTKKPMRDDDFYYYAIVSKNGRFDCILDMSAFETEQQCQDAIVKAKKLDEEAGWYYEYSKPKVIKIVTKDIKPLLCRHPNELCSFVWWCGARVMVCCQKCGKTWEIKR